MTTSPGTADAAGGGPFFLHSGSVVYSPTMPRCKIRPVASRHVVVQFQSGNISVSTIMFWGQWFCELKTCTPILARATGDLLRDVVLNLACAVGQPYRDPAMFEWPTSFEI